MVYASITSAFVIAASSTNSDDYSPEKEANWSERLFFCLLGDPSNKSVPHAAVMHFMLRNIASHYFHFFLFSVPLLLEDTYQI